MLEIENKYAVKELKGTESKLRELGAIFDNPRDDVDQYFNAPNRNFAQTDEALRLRRIGLANFVTYKGPKIDAQTKTRTEIEIPLAEGDAVAQDFTKLLVALGYRPVAVVKKRRLVCHLRRGEFDLEACLDDVAGVGKYVELEIMAEPNALEPAKAELLGLAKELGLDTPERRSYLELLLGQRG